jgi:16S rRNA (cytosine1402-N4)-methyltransferase
LRDVLRLLNASAGGRFLDCTFGGGGHGAAILEANGKNFLHAIDRDREAWERAKEFSMAHGDNFRFHRMNFAEVGCLRLPPMDGILMDLGVSSFQLDDAGRGFSFRHHAPLDMRMDNGHGVTAAEFLLAAPERDLVTAVRDCGEERHWRKVVRAIISNRKTGALAHADTFARIVANCIPERRGRIHPATKTFQGLRIFINDELRSLEMALPLLFDLLKPGGRLAVICFHSLEDRIVKKFFNGMAGRAIDRFDGRPKGDRVVRGNILTKKALVPDEGETLANPRSRSAKLRVLERVQCDGED